MVQAFDYLQRFEESDDGWAYCAEQLQQCQDLDPTVAFACLKVMMPAEMAVGNLDNLLTCCHTRLDPRKHRLKALLYPSESTPTKHEAADCGSARQLKPLATFHSQQDCSALWARVRGFHEMAALLPQSAA